MDLIERWGAPSFRRFADLHRSSEAEASGVQLMQVISVSDEPGRERPPWAHMVPLFRDLTSRDLELAGLGEFKDGFTFSSFVADPWRYLPYLQSKCRDAGVTLTAAKVASLEQLADMAPGSSNVVVNCTGLGAKELFGDDLVYPVRGQIIRVRAPWVRAVWHVNDDTYIIPNTGAVVLGE